jgi:hypothetical protein
VHRGQRRDRGLVEGGGAGVVTASTFAAYPPSETTKVSSPTGVGWRNSSEREPPIAPASAWQITVGSPSRSKVRW